MLYQASIAEFFFLVCQELADVISMFYKININMVDDDACIKLLLVLSSSDVLKVTGYGTLY